MSCMKLSASLLGSLLVLTSIAALAGDDLPKTLMTMRGKLLASEDFAKPLAPFTGKPVGFASGFTGWRPFLERTAWNREMLLFAQR